MVLQPSVELIRNTIPDDDGLWEIEIRATNGRYAVGQQFYAYPENFADFITKLQTFGTSVRDEAIFESGKDRGDWAHFVLLHVFIHSPIAPVLDLVVPATHLTLAYGRPPFSEDTADWSDCTAGGDGSGDDGD